MAELTSVGKQIQLDFARSLNPVVVYAKHGDVNSRTITVEPLKNGETYTLSNGITAKFACKKPDGKYIYNDYPTVVPSTNLITVPLTEQTLAAAGEAICSVILYDEENQKVLSTQNFILQIEPSPMTFAELESTDEIQTIYGLMTIQKSF